MENITPYGIAIIGGGFTIVGALIGAVIAYWLARQLESFRERSTACARLRSSFSPALAQLYLGRRHNSTHDAPDTDRFMETYLLNHAAAIEEFRPFVNISEHAAYQKAWDEYYQSVKGGLFIAAHTNSSDPWKVLEKNIQTILEFAKT